MKQFILNPDKEFAYFLGFLWADGHVKYNTVTFGFLNKDYEVIKNVFEHLGIINYKPKQLPNRQLQAYLAYSDKNLGYFLKQHNYHTKSIESADSIIDWLPTNLRRYWYLGFLDGDGCFYINDKYSLCQITFSGPYDQKWTFMEKLCLNLKINQNKIKRTITPKGHKYSQFLLGSKKNFLNLGNFLYPNGYEFGLTRKYEIYKNFLDNGWNKSQFQNQGSKIHTKSIIQTANSI